MAGFVKGMELGMWQQDRLTPDPSPSGERGALTVE
jgi:hypothetical protein